MSDAGSVTVVREGSAESGSFCFSCCGNGESEAMLGCWLKAVFSGRDISRRASTIISRTRMERAVTSAAVRPVVGIGGRTRYSWLVTFSHRANSTYL